MNRLVLHVLCSLCIAVVFLPYPGEAQTDHSGTCTGTFAAAGNPHRLTGFCTVPEGETLTIEPGVTLVGQNNSLTVDGQLEINRATLTNVALFYRGASSGSIQESTIQTTASSGTPFPLFISGSATPTIMGTTFQIERVGARGASISQEAQPTLTNNTFMATGISTTAIEVSGTAQPTLTENLITTDFQGIVYDGAGSGGTVTNNTIDFVASGGTGRRAIVLRQGASPMVARNIVNNDGSRADIGIEVAVDATSTVTVTNNRICATGDDRPLTLSPAVFGTAGLVTVRDNNLACGLGAGLGLVANTTVAADATFRIIQGQQDYTLLGTWTVATGATLTIPADVTITGQSQIISINGRLEVNEATLTDVGLLYRGTGSGTVRNSTIMTTASGMAFPVQISDTATPTFREVMFQLERVGSRGAFISGTAQPTLVRNTFMATGTSTTAIQVTGMAQPTLTANLITTNFQGVIYDGTGSGGTVSNNTINFVADGGSGRRAMVLNQGASPRVTGNIINNDESRADIGIEIGVGATSTTTVTNNRICATGGDYPLTLSAAVFGTTGLVTVRDNNLACGLGAGLGLVSSTAAANATFRAVQGQQTYTVLGNWTVANGVTLTIPPDFTILGGNLSFSINGRLNVNRATLTDLGLIYRGEANGTVRASTLISTADGGLTFPVLVLDNAAPTFTANTLQIERNGATGFFIANTARPLVQGNTFLATANSATAIRVMGTARPTLRDNRITTNFQGILYDGTAEGGTATNNTIMFVADGRNERRAIILRQGASPVVDGNSIRDDERRADIGIEVGVDATSTATVINNRLCVTGEDRAFTLGAGFFGTTASATVENNLLVCESGASIALLTDTVNTDTTLRAVQGQQTYALLGPWTIAAGATLTLPADFTLSGPNPHLNVNGTLNADGVTFTNVSFTFRGAGNGTIANSTIVGSSNPSMTLIDATVTLTGNVFEGLTTGMSLFGATTVVADGNTFRRNNTVFSIGAPEVSMTITNNTFEANGQALVFNNAETLFAAFPEGFSAPPEAPNSNTFVGTATENTIRLPNSLNVSGTLRAAPVPYTCFSSVTIVAAVTVDVEPGTVLQCTTGGTIQVDGELRAVGTLERPVIFTVANPKTGNRWSGLIFNNKPAGATTSRLQHCIIEFARTGITFNNASVPVSECRITDNAMNGISLMNGSVPRIENSAIVQNGMHGIQSASGSNPLVQHNAIFGNGFNGLQNDDADLVIFAENNFWGDNSGPRDVPTDARCTTLSNTDGLGDEVSDCVDFDPWTRIGPSIVGTLAAVSGTGQTGSAGEILPEPLIVEVRDLAGRPRANIEVIFSVTQGDATVREDMPVFTRSNGRAAATVQLGQTPGEVRIAATARDVDSPLAIFIGQTNVPALFTLYTTGGCPRDGDVNDDNRLTPADARLILQHFLEALPSPLGLCAQARADVWAPPAGPVRELTPADAVCILQAFLGRSSCLNVVTPIAARLTASP